MGCFYFTDICWADLVRTRQRFGELNDIMILSSEPTFLAYLPKYSTYCEVCLAVQTTPHPHPTHRKNVIFPLKYCENLSSMFQWPQQVIHCFFLTIMTIAGHCFHQHLPRYAVILQRNWAHLPLLPHLLWPAGGST